MIRFLGDNIWQELPRLAKKCRRKYAAVAYVTTGETLLFGEGDLLIVDASDHAIKTGQTSAPVLENALRKGSEIYSNPSLHAKLILFDSCALIGSANISKYSRDTLLETAVLTDHPSVMSAARAYLERLKKRSQRIDSRFIRHILSLEVVRHWKPLFFPKKPRRTSIRLKTHRTWLIGVSELEEDKYKAEAQDVRRGEKAAEKRKEKLSSEVSWIRWTGAGRFRKLACEGDSVIQIWRSLGAKRPSEVYRHYPILLKQAKPKWTRFYVEQSENAETETLTWGAFKRLAKQIGISERIGPRTERLLTEEESNSLDALWRRSRHKR